MIWRWAASLAVALLCAGCMFKAPKDDLGHLAYEGASNPWIVDHVRNNDGDYLEGFYDPHPLGPELCTAARIRIPIKIQYYAQQRYVERQRVIAFSPCKDASARQFGSLDRWERHLFNSEELRTSFLDIDAMIRHGSAAVPGVQLMGAGYEFDTCDMTSTIKWDNLETADEVWIAGSDRQLEVTFVGDKTAPEYADPHPQPYMYFRVLFTGSKIINIDAFSYYSLKCTPRVPGAAGKNGR
jgi:hypothetical protein